MASPSSPGGTLLRASRIFSIPTPLPRPASSISSLKTFDSETATLPYPTHLSITTPQSSLKRGDWGFKRPLPLRVTTKSSTPLIRVQSIDTYEHVTDFASAADHTVSLQKWQEMGVPLSTPPERSSMGSQEVRLVNDMRSVFEDEIDTIASDAARDVRWKFKGPWLAGQSEGEFKAYLTKEISHKKHEFRQFLREQCAIDINKEAHKKSIENAEGEFQSIEASGVTEEDLTKYIKRLRAEKGELFGQIRKFLDLPPPPPHNIVDEAVELFFQQVLEGHMREPAPSLKVESKSLYATHGPPKTHPSAGLFYGRTASHLYNHHVYGPQKDPPPVEARIVLPRAAARNASPALGVGGFVTDIPKGTDAFNIHCVNKPQKSRKSLVPGLLSIEEDKSGGSKTWVHPRAASVHSSGKVIMEIAPATDDAVQVRTGDKPEHQTPPPYRSAEKVMPLSRPEGTSPRSYPDLS